MQFEFISCFRWSLANQGRHEADVGASKLTTPRPWLFKKGENEAETRRQPPHPALQPALPWGSLELLPGRAQRAATHPAPGPPPRVPTMPLCGGLSHSDKQGYRSCHNLVNKEETQAFGGREGSRLRWGKEGPTHLKWVHVILSETKDESS